MNKNEILEKAKLENIDEGLVQAELKGYKLGFYVTAFIYATISICNLIFAFVKDGQMNEFYVASSMYFSFLGMMAYKKYKFIGDKKQKFNFISSMVASSIFFITWFLKTLWP